MHEIKMFTYPENVNKKRVQKELDHLVAIIDWQEGAIGLPKDIRWEDYICKNIEEAREYIEKIIVHAMTN